MRREIVFVGTHADCQRAFEALPFPTVQPAGVTRITGTDAWQLTVGETVAADARRALRAAFPIMLTIDRGAEGAPITVSSADVVSAELSRYCHWPVVYGMLTAQLRDGWSLSARIALADVAAVERWIEAAP